MTEIFDCSPVAGPALAVWPGDAPFRLHWSQRIGPTSPINLSSLQSTLHLGSHADAPLHYVDNGQSIDQCALEPFLGPSRVIEVDRRTLLPDGRIPSDAVECQLTSIPPRVLFKTKSFDPYRPFDNLFASLSPGLVDRLAAMQVVLVGIDTPSVDPLDDGRLLSHARLAAHAMRNLEGLVLDHVPPGDYELIALPLKLFGADASPIRAILRKL